MPYLGGLPVIDEEPRGPVLNGFEDSRTLAFRSLDGADLIPFTGQEYIARWGITGLKVPPRDVVEVNYPGEDGGQLDDISTSSRTWGIPVRVTSESSHAGYLDNEEALRRLFNYRGIDYRKHGGTFDLVANSVKGERALRSAYLSGLEGDWQQATSGSYFDTLPIVGKSVRPYWTGPRWQTPPIMRPPMFDFFGQWPPVGLSPSRTLGADITVTVDGDASGYCRVDLTGFCPSVEVTGPGLRVMIPGGLADGETAYIDTYPPQAGVYFNGLLDWSRVSPVRQMRAIAPGDNAFNIDLGVAGATASAIISGPTLWETPW